SKFVEGDAIAAIIIVSINLIGGFAIGLTKGLSLQQSITTYSLLSVGDGLVSQIPALLLSIATGRLVTRVDGSGDPASEPTSQLFKRKEAVRIASLMVGGLALVPGLPKIPFVVAAVVLWVVASRASEPVPAPELEVPSVNAHPDDPDAILAEVRV